MFFLLLFFVCLFVFGVFVSSPSTCILFSSDSVPSDFYNTIQRHIQVGDVLKLVLLAWSRTLDLKGAVFFVVVFSGVLVSLPSTYILFW